MTDEEQHAFCGQICMAARKLGIYGRIEPTGFVWFDPMNHGRIHVDSGKDDKETLQKACERLVEELQWKTPH
jgi:hypothetical protein